MYSGQTELFEIELIIYFKMDLALNNLQRLIRHKTQPTNQLTKSTNQWKTGDSSAKTFLTSGKFFNRQHIERGHLLSQRKFP